MVDAVQRLTAALADRYRIERELGQVVPIDQFLWSGHVELVALFRRNRL